MSDHQLKGGKRSASRRRWARNLALIACSSALVGGGAGDASAQIQRLLGLDVSAWQGNISQTTWNNIHNVENRQFIIIRSSRGGTTGYYDQNDSANAYGRNTLSQRYDDPYYIQNINRVVAAGMFAGSYHFSRPDIIETTLNAGGIRNNGTDEANHFMQMAGPWMRPGYLPPIHDLEAGSGIRTSDEMAQFCLDFANRIYAVMGIRPGLYLNGSYAGTILAGAAASLRNQLAQPPANLPSVVSPAYPTLWNARWPNQTDPASINVQTGEPKDSYSTTYGPWDDYGVTHPWKFWQYTSKLLLPSYNSGGSNLDADVVRGGFEFLKDQLIPAVWMNDASGDWSTLTNWNSGQTPATPVTGPGQVAPAASSPLPTPRLPGAAGTGTASGQNDTVILERPNANITVTLSTGTHNIRKLYMRETLNITGGSLAINYAPSADSTTNGAQFSGPVTLGGSGSLSVHTLQVDAAQTFTLAGGTLTFNTLNLMPHSTTPAKILLSGDVSFNALSNVTTVIAKGGGSGASGFINLGGGTRAFDVGNGAADVDLSVNVAITNGALAKAGPGTLALNSANTYSGGTTLSAGRLLVNNTTNSGTGSGGVTVNGGILGGTGTIAGALTVNSGGTVAPGTTPSLGVLTFNSAPAFAGTNLMRINRNGGNSLADKLVLTSGTLTYAGTLVVSNTGAALTGGELFAHFTAGAYAGGFAAASLPALSGSLNWYLGHLAVNGTIRVNRQPVVSGLAVTNTPGLAVPIPVASLLSSATDADGDSLALAGFDPATTNGIALSSDSNYIYYLNNANVADRFTYTITDGHGGTATGQVQICPGVMPPPRVDSIRLKPDGQVQLYLSALPGHYVVEASTSLVSWVELSNFITSGVTFEYLDSATNQSQRFYRARLIP
jgi:autotransporter-associated beta strand protein